MCGDTSATAHLNACPNRCGSIRFSERGVESRASKTPRRSAGFEFVKVVKGSSQVFHSCDLCHASVGLVWWQTQSSGMCEAGSEIDWSRKYGFKHATGLSYARNQNSYGYSYTVALCYSSCSLYACTYSMSLDERQRINTEYTTPGTETNSQQSLQTTTSDIDRRLRSGAT